MNISFLRFVNADSAAVIDPRRRASKSTLHNGMPLEVQSLEPRLPLAASVAGLGSLTALADADTVAPEVRSLIAPNSRTYSRGDTISFRVRFTEPVVVTGMPTLPITIGETVRQAVWNGKGSGGSSLVFKAVVQSGDRANGVQVAGPISLAGGTISDKAGNALVPEAAGTFPRVKVDAVGPRVTQFGTPVVSGKIVSLRVTFDEAVRVTGKPSIPFTLADVPKQFVYARGAGTNVLTFRFKAAAGEVPTLENVAVPAQTILLNGGTMTDRFGVDFSETSNI